MQPWEERFLEEYKDLRDRTEKLANMLVGYEADTLPFKPKCAFSVLHEQLIYMKGYLKVLEERALIENIKLED